MVNHQCVGHFSSNAAEVSGIPFMSDCQIGAPVFCIMGPTASGKTALSLALSKEFPVEIINVDSAQIYCGMDIGSGKPEKSILDTIPHHLINILDPKESYSVWQFCQATVSLIESIQKRNKIPLLVGGTMLYFKALQEGISYLPTSSPEIRETIFERGNQQGWEALYQYLQQIDPITAERLSPNDKQRISRALEVYEMTKTPLSTWIATAYKTSSPYRFMNIALIPQETDRAILHERIKERFDEMLAKGLVEETRQLAAREDLHENLPAIRAVGYRQVWQYLHQTYSFSEMRERAIAATRQLAKRQLTWLRHWSNCKLFDFADPKKAYEVIKKHLITS